MSLPPDVATVSPDSSGYLSSVWKVVISSGAIAGYLSLLWNFWGSRVRVAASAEYLDFVGGIRFQVSNRGNRPTTLTKIEIKEPVRDGLLGTHNLGASPDTGGIELPAKLVPGEHWTGSVGQAEKPEDGCDEAKLLQYEKHLHRFGWLADEQLVGRCAVLMYFSHRNRPYRLRVRLDADCSIGFVDAVRFWWSSRKER